jgi:aminopeptidase
MGLPFTANLPTEEVFTLPHRAQVEGRVTATKPLLHGGLLVKGLRLEFAGGQVVGAWAEHGQAHVERLLATDDGAARLGEIALVPHSSPISRHNRLFHSVLIDENASVHLALGYAYPSSLGGGQSLEPAAFAVAGGNASAIHVDFMAGSEHMDVDGLTEAGEAEPILRQGEWAWPAAN